MDRLIDILSDPEPWRLRFARALVRRLPFSWETRYRFEACSRQHYAFCMLSAAQLAFKLGYPKISALEFGVAGGNGLVRMEQHARAITRLTGIEFEIYGFDRGIGLPEPQDYRDVPYIFQRGGYQMDRMKLEERLTKSRLVMGDVSDTVPSFFHTYDPAPVGCVFHDMDFYTSTRDGLRLFSEPEEHFLPRVCCYFDDVVGAGDSLYCEFTGERLAINEFNQAHLDRKVASSPHAVWRRHVGPRRWHWAIYVAHFFNHPRYGRYVGEAVTENPLMAEVPASV